MSEAGKGQSIGLLLKTLLKEQSLSMRKLSSLTGIDTATISRIASGKQQAKPDHLKKIAVHLGVPLERLMKDAGIDFGMERDERYLKIQETMDIIQGVLVPANLLDQQFSLERVQQELTKYEQYALTEEGKKIIFEKFHSKVEQVSGAGPFIDHLKNMYVLFSKEDITMEECAILGSALLYFILSADIIPDYIFPIGYLDDAIAVQLVLNKLAQRDKKNSTK